MALSMRRASPASTLPGPISRPRSTPSAARARTDSTQRTGASTWRARASESALPRVSGRASTLVTTGNAASEKRAARRSGRSRSRAGAMSAQWNGAETARGMARLAPRAVQAADARAPEPLRKAVLEVAPGRDRVRQDGRLRVGRLFQLFLGPLEAEARK